MITGSRFYPAEAGAITSTARELAAANAWPQYLTDAIPAFFGLTDDRLDRDGEIPTKGAWLSALAALWVSDLKEEPAPGWYQVASVIGAAAELALAKEYQAASAPSAFAAAWAKVKKGAENAAQSVADTAEELADRADKIGKGLFKKAGAVLALAAGFAFLRRR